MTKKNNDQLANRSCPPQQLHDDDDDDHDNKILDKRRRIKNERLVQASSSSSPCYCCCSLSKQLYGLALLVISSFLYSIMGVFIKLASSSSSSSSTSSSAEFTTTIPSTELVLFRALFQGTIVVVCMALFRDEYSSASCPQHDEGKNGDKPTPPQPQPQQPQPPRVIVRPFGRKEIRNVVILRGIVGGLGFCFYYYTLSHLPLGDATALLSLNPIVTVLAASVLLNEKLQVSHIVAAMASVVGSILIAQPNIVGVVFDGGDHPPPLQEGDDANDDFVVLQSSQPAATTTTSNFGYVTALLGTCCAAGVYILIRKAGQNGVHTLQLLFSWVVFGILFSSIVEIVATITTTTIVEEGNNTNTQQFVWPQSIPITTWYYVLGVCVFGSIGHFLMNYAGRFAPAGLTSIVRSSGIFFSYIWEILIFHEVPSTGTVLGVTLIFASLFVVALQQRQQQQQREQGAMYEKHSEELELTEFDDDEDLEGDNDDVAGDGAIVGSSHSEMIPIKQQGNE